MNHSTEKSRPSSTAQCTEESRSASTEQRPESSRPSSTDQRPETFRAFAQDSAARRPLSFVADLLSLGNLGCGLASIYLATRFELSWCLLLLGVGALLDGLDGAAARRWGGSRFGVLADDVADAVNYGVAPAVAIAWVVGGGEGLMLGVGFALFVMARLVFFTLEKDNADPRYFRGVPSTIGGIIVLCSLILFPTTHALLGFMIGIACAQMVAFSTPHRHLGRFLAEHPRTLRLAPVALIAVIAMSLFRGPAAAAGAVLALSWGYGIWPDAKRLGRAFCVRTP